MTLTELSKFSLRAFAEDKILPVWVYNLLLYVFISLHFASLSDAKTLPGAMSSGMSNEYVTRENLGVWSLTSFTVMFSLMSEDCFPSSARTRREYFERRSRSSFLVAIRSPDSGSIRKLSSAPLMIVYVTRALGPWGEDGKFGIIGCTVFHCFKMSSSQPADQNKFHYLLAMFSRTLFQLSPSQESKVKKPQIT